MMEYEENENTLETKAAKVVVGALFTTYTEAAECCQAVATLQNKKPLVRINTRPIKLTDDDLKDVREDLMYYDLYLRCVCHGEYSSQANVVKFPKASLKCSCEMNVQLSTDREIKKLKIKSMNLIHNDMCNEKNKLDEPTKPKATKKKLPQKVFTKKMKKMSDPSEENQPKETHYSIRKQSEAPLKEVGNIKTSKELSSDTEFPVTDGGAHANKSKSDVSSDVSKDKQANRESVPSNFDEGTKGPLAETQLNNENKAENSSTVDPSLSSRSPDTSAANSSGFYKDILEASDDNEAAGSSMGESKVEFLNSLDSTADVSENFDQSKEIDESDSSMEVSTHDARAATRINLLSRKLVASTPRALTAKPVVSDNDEDLDDLHFPENRLKGRPPGTESITAIGLPIIPALQPFCQKTIGHKALTQIQWLCNNVNTLRNVHAGEYQFTMDDVANWQYTDLPGNLVFGNSGGTKKYLQRYFENNAAFSSFWNLVEVRRRKMKDGEEDLYYCPICKILVLETGINCDSCDMWLHYACEELEDVQIKKYELETSKISYFCKKCTTFVGVILGKKK